MNKIEEGRRFTDANYASKAEIEATYNQGDILSVWDNVLFYRSFYDTETELIDTHKNHYKICLTKGLLSESYRLQCAAMEKSTELFMLPKDLSDSFRISRLISSMKETAKYQNIQIGEETIEKIAKNELESASSKFFPLRAYEKAYRYAISVPEITKEVIENINKLVSGSELDSEVSYRKSDTADVINPLLLPKKEEIGTYIDSFFLFLKQEDIPLFVQALGIIYFFTFVRPFEFCSEETGGFVAKAFLKTKGESAFGFFLPFESLSYTTSPSYFRKLKTSEESLDLTYFIDTTLRFLHYSMDLLSEDLKEVQKKYQERVTVTPLMPSDNLSNDIPVKEEVSFALPVFPPSKNETEIDILSKKLSTVYPQLKRKQAHFYAGHCQIGLNYTIEQFRKEEKTVYETARTSMEDLAKRGFYKKLQIGKKFVYTPMPLKDIND